MAGMQIAICETIVCAVERLAHEEAPLPGYLAWHTGTLVLC